ncbi:hypothetical protein JOM56_002293 [Amanita muscaria]
MPLKLLTCSIPFSVATRDTRFCNNLKDGLRLLLLYCTLVRKIIVYQGAQVSSSWPLLVNVILLLIRTICAVPAPVLQRDGSVSSPLKNLNPRAFENVPENIPKSIPRFSSMEGTLCFNLTFLPTYRP